MTLTTPNSHTIVLRDFITGRQREYIDRAQMDAVKTSAAYDEQGKVKIQFGEVDTVAVMTAERYRKVECFVESVDGNTEKVLDLVLDLPEQDYEAVLAAVDEASKKKDTSVQTTPSSVEP